MTDVHKNSLNAPGSQPKDILLTDYHDGHQTFQYARFCEESGYTVGVAHIADDDSCSTTCASSSSSTTTKNIDIDKLIEIATKCEILLKQSPANHFIHRNNKDPYTCPFASQIVKCIKISSLDEFRDFYSHYMRTNYEKIPHTDLFYHFSVWYDESKGLKKATYIMMINTYMLENNLIKNRVLRDEIRESIANDFKLMRGYELQNIYKKKGLILDTVESHTNKIENKYREEERKITDEEKDDIRCYFNKLRSLTQEQKNEIVKKTIVEGRILDMIGYCTDYNYNIRKKAQKILDDVGGDVFEVAKNCETRVPEIINQIEMRFTVREMTLRVQNLLKTHLSTYYKPYFDI